MAMPLSSTLTVVIDIETYSGNKIVQNLIRGLPRWH